MLTVLHHTFFFRINDANSGLAEEEEADSCELIILVAADHQNKSKNANPS